MGQSRLHVLSVQDHPVSTARAFAVLPVNAKVHDLNNAWQVGPSIIVDTAILVEGAFCVGLEKLISLYLLEAVVVFIAIFALLEDGVELEVGGVAGNVLALRKGLVLLL